MSTKLLSYGILVTVIAFGIVFYLDANGYWARKKFKADRVYYHLGVAVYRIVDADS